MEKRGDINPDYTPQLAGSGEHPKQAASCGKRCGCRQSVGQLAESPGSRAADAVAGAIRTDRGPDRND